MLDNFTEEIDLVDIGVDEDGEDISSFRALIVYFYKNENKRINT